MMRFAASPGRDPAHPQKQDPHPMKHPDHQRRNRDFRCANCKQPVASRSHGTRHRNHCPYCLWSRHVDESVGDRRAGCGAGMQPIGIEVRPDGEWAIIHRCTACQKIRVNRIAGDDRELALLQLALRPLAFPPFPLDDLRVANG